MVVVIGYLGRFAEVHLISHLTGEFHPLGTQVRIYSISVGRRYHLIGLGFPAPKSFLSAALCARCGRSLQRIRSISSDVETFRSGEEEG